YGGYGYGGYGYGYGYGYPYYNYGMYGNALPYDVAQATDDAAQPGSKSDAQVLADQGESDFKKGDYKAAAYAWRHAAVDDPKNGVILMMLSQALFATGKYDEAAGAAQQAMQFLPDDQWGVVITNYRELYGKTGDYTSQLRALEKSVKDHGDDPATRFLLGFHYAYLGYPSHAVKQLDKTLELAPQDDLAKKVRDLMAAKLSKQ
ncbi:MAG TPA: tetratricopeptide repeat protein, partial [Pirellulales bacterium]|nr:tetratricopeptide repeat protein [Pirellulales bacterium]